jgi:hypothetical protein
MNRMIKSVCMAVAAIVVAEAVHGADLLASWPRSSLPPPSITSAGGRGPFWASYANDQFAYPALASPCTLTANTTCYLASKELANEECWYQADCGVIGSGVSTVNEAAASSDGQNWVPQWGGSSTFGPVNFQYSADAAQPVSSIRPTNIMFQGTPTIDFTGHSNPIGITRTDQTGSKTFGPIGSLVVMSGASASGDTQYSQSLVVSGCTFYYPPAAGVDLAWDPDVVITNCSLSYFNGIAPVDFADSLFSLY